MTCGKIHISRKGNVFFHRNKTTEKEYEMSNKTDTRTELLSSDGKTSTHAYLTNMNQWYQWKLADDLETIEKLEKEIRNLKAQIREMISFRGTKRQKKEYKK